VSAASAEKESIMALTRWTPGWGLARWQPEHEFQRLRTEMDRLFDEAFGESGESGWRGGAWAPPVDLYDADEAFVIKAELPGMNKDDIHIEVHDRTLTLRGERKHEAEVKEERYQRRERAYGSFQRTFWLPATVEAEKIQASFKDGLLELRLPKSETAKPKHIAIKG
jgi:HSP20 family protein